MNSKVVEMQIGECDWKEKIYFVVRQLVIHSLFDWKPVWVAELK